MFAIPRTERRQGSFESPNLPFRSVARAFFDQGVHDQGFNQIKEWVEGEIYSDGAQISPQEANERFSLPGLEFNEPVNEGFARLLYRRKQKEIARHTIMQQGDKGLASMRGIGSMAVSVIANNLNPLDFAFNFVPVVGQTRYGKPLANLTRAGSKGRIAGGLGKSVKRTSVPFAYKAIASSVDAGVGNLVLEVPLYYSDMRDQTPHTLKQSLASVGLGMAFGGTLSMLGSALRATAGSWNRASASTKDKIIKDVVGSEFDGRLDEAIENADALLEADPANRLHKVVEELIYARTVAKRELNADMPVIQAAAEARIEVEGKLGNINKADLEVIAGKILPDMLKKGDARAKLISKLLDRSKSGELDATDNLASSLHMEHNPNAKGVPEPFASGKFSKDLTLQKLDNIKELLAAVPPKGKRALRGATQERFDLDAEIKQRVKDIGDAQIAKSFERQVERIERRANEEARAGKAYQESKAVNEASTPPVNRNAVKQRIDGLKSKIAEKKKILEAQKAKLEGANVEGGVKSGKINTFHAKESDGTIAGEVKYEMSDDGIPIIRNVTGSEKVKGGGKRAWDEFTNTHKVIQTGKQGDTISGYFVEFIHRNRSEFKDKFEAVPIKETGTAGNRKVGGVTSFKILKRFLGYKNVKLTEGGTGLTFNHVRLTNKNATSGKKAVTDANVEAEIKSLERELEQASESRGKFFEDPEVAKRISDEEAMLATEISRLDAKAPSSLKVMSEAIPHDAIRQATECIIKNAL